MTRSKKIFVGFAIVFFGALGYLSYDISSRTTFPGSKSQLKERLKSKFGVGDSTETDTTKYIHR